MPRHPQLQTQFIILVLFGDVIRHRGGQAWTASLLQMLQVLGVSERAARSTLSRMRRKGWLRPERDGRHSQYALTGRGRRLLDEGGQRIFEPHKWHWDGHWHLVVYSLPEDKRRQRNDLRRRLAWLGFGRLAPGTWISPHDRREDVAALLDDLGVCRYARVFSGLKLALGEDQDIVQQCWDLPGINRQYARFIARWEPEYEKCVDALVRGDGLSPSACFAQRFWITHEYSPFPQMDPNLPDELLPEAWLGQRATEIFNEYRRLLNERSDEFVTAALQGPNGLRLGI